MVRMTQYQIVADGDTVLRDGTIKLHGPPVLKVCAVPVVWPRKS
jgi:hypothetical protein